VNVTIPTAAPHRHAENGRNVERKITMSIVFLVELTWSIKYIIFNEGKTLVPEPKSDLYI
jgi:hypothetical protein